MSSSPIETIAHKLKEGGPSPLFRDPADTAISINRLTGKAGTWYEKVRYLLDYKEERFVKRSAVERILRRKILFGKDTNIGLSLLQELIRGGYLPNDEIPEKVAIHIDEIIAKFRKLFRLSLKEGINSPSFEHFTTSLASSEIYHLLYPAVPAEHTIESMYSYIRDRVSITPEPTESDQNIQIYIACRRSVLKETDEELSYALFQYFIPDWHTANIAVEGVIERIALNIGTLRQEIERMIKHRLSWKVARKIKNYGIAFSLIRELADTYGGELSKALENPGSIETEISRILDRRYEQEHRRAFWSGVHAVFYIFCTKILVAVLLELPYDLLVVKEINYLAIGINVVFHPFVLFLMTSTIPKLGKDNTAKILSVIHNVMAGKTPESIRIGNDNGTNAFNTIFVTLYFILFVISFGFIVAFLSSISFNIVSITLFLFFLTLISYFGLRIRYTATEWRFSSDAETTMGLLWSLLTLPIIRVGRRLTKAFSAINVFVLIMDFIIEAPFKLVLHVFDAFLWFLKEKREEVD